jgi:HTH-type transcriptional regulator/antitoxin HigA
MRLQSQYDIDVAKIKEKNIIKNQNIEAYRVIEKIIPVKYFIKKGYFIGNLALDIAKAFEIYATECIDGLIKTISIKKSELESAYFRKSEKLDINVDNTIAWIALAEYKARNKEVNTFSFENITQLNKELNEIFYQNKDTLNIIDEKLSQYGIKLIIVEKLDKTPIDGCAFWHEKNPVIAITKRINRIDNLAFTIMHEIGHVVLHLKQNHSEKIFDMNDGGNKEKECEADVYASTNIINNETWQDIKANINHINDNDINLFAEKYRVHPAIILGRFKHEKNNYRIRTSIDSKVY